MAMQDILQELKDFDVNDLDFENIGSWPSSIKVIVWLVVFIAVLAIGYFYIISDLQKWSMSVGKLLFSPTSVFSCMPQYPNQQSALWQV